MELSKHRQMICAVACPWALYKYSGALFGLLPSGFEGSLSSAMHSLEAPVADMG